MYLGIESTSKSKINIYFYLTADQLSSLKNKISDAVRNLQSN